HLNPHMLEALDWWIKCLKDEGIYVWLDLHVGRHFTRFDGIDDFVEISKSDGGSLKGFNYFNGSILTAMQEFNEAYLNHRNVFSGVKYKDDPAIIAILLSNENDLTGHMANLLLHDKNVPRHNERYMASADRFARTHQLPLGRTWRSWEPGPSKLFLNDAENRFNVALIERLRKLGVVIP